MAQRLTFSIEDARVVDESPDSRFAVISLDFFASGENKHDMYVDEETLFRTANSIKNCPIVWKYDEGLDDIYTHDSDEVPCGFVPENSEVTSRVLPDGRTMLNVKAFLWKRYTGKLMKILRRDGGKKPVSVEIVVSDTKKLPNGLTQLKDFVYQAITMLGTFISPAIPLAKGTVISFSEIANEYETDLAVEFSNDQNVITFPYRNRSDLNPALKGISPPITASQANEIARQAEAIGVDEGKNGWAIAISNFKKSHKVVDGKWVKKEEKMGDESKETKKEMSVMNEDIIKGEDIKEESPAEEIVENSDPSVESPENNSTEEAPVDMAEDKKEEEEEETVEMQEDEKEGDEEDKKENEEEDMAEEKKEECGEEQMSFEVPSNFMEVLAQMFSGEGEDYAEVKSEIEKGKDADMGVLVNAMFSKLCKMSEEKKSYMSELEELKKFQANVEQSQKNFEVEKTIKELEQRVVLPDDAREEMIQRAEEFSFAELEQWKIECKAKSFEFAVREERKADVIKVGLPFSKPRVSGKKRLWSS